MFNNNWNGGYGYGQNGGFANYNYNYNRPKAPEPTNPLTPEQMSLLKQKAPQFSLAVSEVESLRAICTHRDKTGDKLVQNSDGSFTCSICGRTFEEVKCDQETVESIFKATVDCLETIKTLYFDIPDDVTKAYFQMIPYLEKGPQLFKVAVDHFNRYGNSRQLNSVQNGGNAYNLFQSIMGTSMGMGMGMAQPGMAPNMGMGMGMPQQGMMNSNMGMNAPVPDVTMTPAASGNPFDSASPSVNAAKSTATVTNNKQYSL